MLPFILAAVGGYLVYDSLKKPVKGYADGGKIDVTKLKKGDEITINMGDGNEKVKVLSNLDWAAADIPIVKQLMKS